MQCCRLGSVISNTGCLKHTYIYSSLSQTETGFSCRNRGPVSNRKSRSFGCDHCQLAWRWHWSHGHLKVVVLWSALGWCQWKTSTARWDCIGQKLIEICCEVHTCRQNENTCEERPNYNYSILKNAQDKEFDREKITQFGNLNNKCSNTANKEKFQNMQVLPCFLIKSTVMLYITFFNFLMRSLYSRVAIILSKYGTCICCSFFFYLR